MATQTKSNDMLIIELNRQEITDIIGLLTAQLAQRALVNNASGAAPYVNIIENGVIKHRIVFCLGE